MSVAVLRAMLLTGGCYAVTDCTCWREIEPCEITVTVDACEEPAQEQDESDTDERSVTWERPNRRLATVNRAGRTIYPRKAVLRPGVFCRQWSRHKTG
jgi:hypothetical protein